MRFLHLNETAEWCRDHGMVIAEDHFDLLPDDRLSHASRILYAPDGPVGREAEVVETCIAMLGTWDECLLWPTDWDIWEASEDWPRYYGARGARGERASLSVKPGHLFTSSELPDLRGFFAMVIEAGWDAHVLPASGTIIERRLWNSHDGWIDFHSSFPEFLRELAV